MPADYLLGDVEGEEDELYPLDTEHVHREWGWVRQSWYRGSPPKHGSERERSAVGSLGSGPSFPTPPLSGGA